MRLPKSLQKNEERLLRKYQKKRTRKGTKIPKNKYKRTRKGTKILKNKYKRTRNNTKERDNSLGGQKPLPQLNHNV